MRRGSALVLLLLLSAWPKSGPREATGHIPHAAAHAAGRTGHLPPRHNKIVPGLFFPWP